MFCKSKLLWRIEKKCLAASRSVLVLVKLTVVDGVGLKGLTYRDNFEYSSDVAFASSHVKSENFLN